MPSLKDREIAFENKFAHDAELAFKARARCNTLLAHWVSAHFGKNTATTDIYANELIKLDLESGNKQAVLDRLMNDLAGRVSETEIRAQMLVLLQEAQAQIAAETA